MVLFSLVHSGGPKWPCWTLHVSIDVQVPSEWGWRIDGDCSEKEYGNFIKGLSKCCHVLALRWSLPCQSCILFELRSRLRWPVPTDWRYLHACFDIKRRTWAHHNNNQCLIPCSLLLWSPSRMLLVSLAFEGEYWLSLMLPCMRNGWWVHDQSQHPIHAEKGWVQYQILMKL